MSDPKKPDLNVIFVGEPKTIAAIEKAMAGLECIKILPPEDAAYIAESTLKAIRKLITLPN